MDLKQLAALVTVADTGSVTRAAEILHLVQPAVTRQIRTLEHELGVALFERNRNGMRPTEAGEDMLQHARLVLHQIERAKAEVGPASSSLRGLVTVGLLPSTTDLLTVPLVQRAAELHPDIRLRLRVGYAADLQHALERGEVDASLLYASQPATASTLRPLVAEKLCAVAAAGSGLAERQAVAVRDLADHRLVLPAPGQGIRTLLNTAAATLGFDLHAAVETNSMDVQKQLASTPEHWTVLPAGCLPPDIAAGRIEAAPLSEPVVERSIAIATAGDARTRQSVHAIAQLLEALVKELVEGGRWPAARLLAE